MKYADLNQEQRIMLQEANILNGCGPSNWRGPRPDWFFRARCMEHDWNYAVGGSEADRRWADWGFYQAMIKDTRRLGFFSRIYARFKAWVFYRVVRWKGGEHFHYGEPRTYEQITGA